MFVPGRFFFGGNTTGCNRVVGRKRSNRAFKAFADGDRVTECFADRVGGAVVKWLGIGLFLLGGENELRSCGVDGKQGPFREVEIGDAERLTVISFHAAVSGHIR